MSFKDRLQRAVCWWQKKPLNVNFKKIKAASSVDGDE
jgi:hypothetical protein